MKYDITITEILSRTVEVDAENYDEAIQKVENMYSESRVILNADDFACKTIE